MNMDMSFWAGEISNTKLKELEEIMFDCFEPLWCELKKQPKETEKTEYLDACKNTLELKNILNTITRLKQLSNNTPSYNLILDLFDTNIDSFLKTPSSNTDERFNNWIKVLCSYFSASRTLIYIDQLKSNQSKIILAMGTVDEYYEIDDDNEKDNEDDNLLFEGIKEEIEYICGVSTTSDKYIVIPILGCSFEMFQKLNNSIDVSAIHISGHGTRTEKYIWFCKQNITLDQLSSCINRNLDFIFLNCCRSDGFVEHKCLNNCQRTIVYTRDVVAKWGPSDGASFYQNILCNDYSMDDAIYSLTHTQHIHGDIVLKDKDNKIFVEGAYKVYIP